MNNDIHSRFDYSGQGGLGIHPESLAKIALSEIANGSIDQRFYNADLTSSIFNSLVTDEPEYTVKLIRKELDNGLAIQFAETSLQCDSEIVFSAVENHPMSLEYICDDFKKDRELVLKAVTIDGYALQYADQILFKDKKIILETLKTASLSNMIDHIDKNLLSDYDIALASVKLNGSDLKYIDESLKKDEEIVTTAIKDSSFAFEYVDECFKKNTKYLEWHWNFFELK